MTDTTHDTVRAVLWEDGSLRLLDQRLLPSTEVFLEIADAASAARAIHDMVVRGAPAIGITAAYGVVLAARAAWRTAGPGWRVTMEPALEGLAASRPTAVNLFWAIDRMRGLAKGLPDDADPEPALLAAACAIHEEDIAANHHMGALGAALIDCEAVLTHCNTGSLATGGYGTALGVIRRAWADGRIRQVYADETRPWMQGSRLTAWELVRDGIPVRLICEGAAASLMRTGRVGWVIVGADRIAANGDTANKIGTYSLAVNARRHGLRFMVVAPTTTVDLATATGEDIPIEERGAEEILMVGGTRIAAEGAGTWNPAFDVTPAELIDAIVTEKGVVHAPAPGKLAALLQAQRL